MRTLIAVCLVGCVSVVLGCGSRPPEVGAARDQPALPVKSQPLLTGKLEGGTFWKSSLTATGPNEGHDYAKGSRAEVYDQFVVVTTPDGLSHVHPHGHYSGLAIKKD